MLHGHACCRRFPRRLDWVCDRVILSRSTPEVVEGATPGEATGSSPDEIEHVTADDGTAASCDTSVPTSDDRVLGPNEESRVADDDAPVPGDIS